MSNLLDEAKHLKAIGEFSSTEEAINFIIFDTVTPKKEIEEMKESATQEGISFCKVCGSAMIDGECYLCKKVSESSQCVQTDQPAEVFYKSKEVKDLTLGSVVAAVDEDDEDEKATVVTLFNADYTYEVLVELDIAYLYYYLMDCKKISLIFNPETVLLHIELAQGEESPFTAMATKVVLLEVY